MPEGKHPHCDIRQGYLSRGHTSVRVRVLDQEGFLTIKGPSQDNLRPEYEYPIPRMDAEFMLRHLCGGNPIRKTRYFVQHGRHTWHLDVFHDANAPLVLAEIELQRPNEAFELPGWIGAEVSADTRFFNSYLSEHPYGSWAR